MTTATCGWVCVEAALWRKKWCSISLALEQATDGWQTVCLQPKQIICFRTEATQNATQNAQKLILKKVTKWIEVLCYRFIAQAAFLSCVQKAGVQLDSLHNTWCSQSHLGKPMPTNKSLTVLGISEILCKESIRFIAGLHCARVNRTRHKCKYFIVDNFWSYHFFCFIDCQRNQRSVSCIQQTSQMMIWHPGTCRASFFLLAVVSIPYCRIEVQDCSSEAQCVPVASFVSAFRICGSSNFHVSIPRNAPAILDVMRHNMPCYVHYAMDLSPVTNVGTENFKVPSKFVATLPPCQCSCRRQHVKDLRGTSKFIWRLGSSTTGLAGGHVVTRNKSLVLRTIHSWDLLVGWKRITGSCTELSHFHHLLKITWLLDHHGCR